MRLMFTLILLLSIYSCQSTYYYKDAKKEEEIKADSDSNAYKKAFIIYAITQKVYKDYSEKYGSDMVSSISEFKLLNSTREDISKSVYFRTKSYFEDSIINSYKNEPSVISDTTEFKKAGILSKSDTIGVHKSPVKVLSAKFVKREYSNYRDIRLSYKNTSKKTVTAIRFKWYAENAFGEPADVGGLTNGVGCGFTEEILKPGATEYSEWDVLSKDGKTIKASYAYEVVFSDGTKWKLED